MARRPVTKELYGALRQSFAQDEGNAAAAARAAGCERRMAKRGWEIGWPKLGLRPIRDIIEDDRVKARQAAAAVEAEELEHVAAEKALRAETAQEVREAEALMVSLARSDTLALLGSLGVMAKGLHHLGEKLGEKLETIETVVNAKESLSLYKSVASALRSGAMSAKAVVELERQIAGDPAKVPGSTPEAGAGGETREAFSRKTPLELAAEIDRAGAALDRAKRRGLVSIPGGLADMAADDEATDAAEAVIEKEAG